MHLLDSGAIYRVLALAALHHHVDVASEDALVPLASHLDVRFVSTNGNLEVILEGEDVSGEIRTQEVANAASQVAVKAQSFYRLPQQGQRFPAESIDSNRMFVMS